MAYDTDFEDDVLRMQCRHIKPDGCRCGSPAVRDQHLCYYHGKARHAGPRQPQVKTLTDRKASTFDLPSPADLGERSGVQLAIAQVLHKIAHNELDPRRAGLLLYGLQIASMNLPREATPKKAQAVAEPVHELTTDPHLGSLAPEAEYTGQTGPKSTLEQIWDKMEREDRQRAESAARSATESAAIPGDIPRLQARAWPLHSRYDLSWTRTRASWSIAWPLATVGEPAHRSTYARQRRS